MSNLVTPEFEAESATNAHLERSNLTSRRHQIFPTLSCNELKRLERFGRRMVWRDGERVFEAGREGPGMLVILAGKLAISQCTGLGEDIFLVEHGRGEFAAEVGQLGGRPTLVNARARGDLEALAIAPESLRALVIAEAELGERIMRALILRRVALIEAGASTPVLVAPPGHAGLFKLQSFLAANGQPHTVLDPAASEAAAALLAHYAPSASELPLVVCPDGVVKLNPGIGELGRCLGLAPPLDPERIYDVIVVGAGPAGLATAVYAASEGLCVLVVEQRSFGGQAGASARIENYLGFPTGISGRALSGRAFVQAQKFGAEVSIPASAVQLDCSGPPHRLTLDDGSTVQAKSIVIASGARYRKPALEGLEKFEGNGIYYWASPIEAKLAKGEEVVLVGGGNSAGQAAVFLSGHASKVHMLVRAKDLSASMSSYLIERIAATPNIVLHTHTQLTALSGSDDAEGLVWVRWQHKDGTEQTQAIRRVFLFVGADPCTDWLEGCGVQVDQHGFVITGTDVMLARCRVTGQMLNPDGTVHGHLETTVPGVFAIGDVRAGSTKRVAAAVGEGAAVVAQLHAYLSSAP